MYCPNCNTEIDESDRFCQHCGQALSNAREEGKEDSKQETMYKHEYFGNTASVEGDKSYNNKSLENYLNKMFSDGWEVISMEPDWYYEQVGVSMVHEVTKPLVITGWYITFKKRQDG